MPLKFRKTKLGPGTAIVPSPLYDRAHGISNEGGTWLQRRVPRSLFDPRRKVLLTDFRTLKGNDEHYLRFVGQHRLWTSILQMPKVEAPNDKAYHIFLRRADPRDPMREPKGSIYRVSLNDMWTMQRPGLKSTVRVPVVERGDLHRDESGGYRYVYRMVHDYDEVIPLLRLHRDLAQQGFDHLHRDSQARKSNTPERALKEILEDHIKGSGHWFSRGDRPGQQQLF